jgi:oligosaccharide translocation protein RFT1
MLFGTSVFFQSIAKHLLTQGDSMILVAMSTLEDQGIYSLVSNYGGLIARVLFQPIEETSRNLFARLTNRQGAVDERSNCVNAAKAHLVDILQMYGILSALTFSLAPTLVPPALHILIGSRWSSSKVDGLLTVYCYYVPFLAFNGITEAFVASVADSSEMRKQTAWMGAFSVCFAAVSYLFLQLGEFGAYGLVWANIINMVIRTTWSYQFIRSYLHRHGNFLTLSEISLKAQTYTACGLVLSIMSAARKPAPGELQDTVKAFGLGAVCALLM